MIVVGAGPAGATTARYAARAGLKVLTLDRRREIGVPVQCGEYMATDREVESLFPGAGHVGDLYQMPEAYRMAYTDFIRIFSPRGRHWDIPFRGYSVCRDKTDKHWVHLAEREGTEVRTAVNVHGVKGDEVHTTDGLFRARVIVGADGPRSTVARSVGLEWSPEISPAVDCIVEGDFANIAEIYFGSLAPGGYAWVIPKGRVANVGVGVWPKYHLRLIPYLKHFLEVKGFTTEGWTGGWVPSMGAPERTVKGNVILVGDAAGHVMPTNGGGVNLAMLLGREAGNAVAEHILLGRPLDNYEARWRAIAGDVLRTGARIKRFADHFFDQDRLLEMVMILLGQKRMERAIRCQPLFRLRRSPLEPRAAGRPAA